MTSQPSPRVVRLLCCLMLATGTIGALTAAIIVDHPGSLTAAVALTAVLVLTHLRPYRIVAGNGPLTIQPDELILVPLLVLSPTAGVIAAFVISPIAQAIKDRIPWDKTAFNVGQFLAATTAALFVDDQVQTLLPQNQVGEVIAAVIAAVAFTVTSSVCVQGIISYTTGESFREAISSQGWNFLPLAANVSLAALGLALYQTHPGLLALLAVPILLLHQTMGLALGIEQSRARVELMYKAAERIHSAPDATGIRENLAEGAKEVLAAEEVTYADEATGELAAPFGNVNVNVSGRIGGGEWEDEEATSLRSLTSAASAALTRVKLTTRMRTLTESQTEAVIAVETDGNIGFANPAALRLCGWEPTVIGKPMRDVLHLEALTELETAIGAGVHRSGESSLAGDKTIPVAWNASPVEGDEGGTVIVLRDITDERNYREHLARLAYHDELTGLPNRSKVVEHLDGLTGASVVLLDLDRFRLINDAYGHSAGDQLLKETATRLTRGCGNRTVARLSGDEFCVVVEAGDEKGAETLGRELHDLITAPYHIDGVEVYTETNVGIVTSSGHVTGEDLLAAADAAAAEAKRLGSGLVHIHSTQAATSDARGRLELETALRKGIARNELVLHYQPLVDAATGVMAGVEALVRWESPDGMVSPGLFIPVAEESGLIVEIGNWVLDEACRQVSSWNAAHPGRPSLYVSVNVAMRQFARDDIVTRIKDVLARTGLPPRLLCLEVTEGALMDDTSATIEKLNQLRGLGLKVAIDDFGTGYSSLAYLQRFPVDVVKVDQSFVRNLGESRASSEIVTAVVRLSQAVGMGSVAEGVETIEQQEILKRLGCDRLQGYLFSRPVPAPDLLEYWDREHTITLPQPRKAEEPINTK